MQEDYKRFVRVLDDGLTINVPTMEEYDELKRRTSVRFERLESRIAAIEKERPKVEKSEVYTATLFNTVGGTLELSGTEEQHQVFDKSREAIDKSLFPRFLPWDKLVKLALDCGLSVKEIKEK